MTKEEIEELKKFIEISSQAIFKEIYPKQCVSYAKVYLKIVAIINKYDQAEKPKNGRN